MAQNAGRRSVKKSRESTTWITDVTIPHFSRSKRRGGAFGRSKPWWMRWWR